MTLKEIAENHDLTPEGVDYALTQYQNVVRCRDCKHRPIDHREEYNEMTGFGLEFPDSHCPCQCEDDYYNWFPHDDWFCANGERRE